MKWSEVAQSCLTLCNPMDYSLPGSSVHGIFQAIVLEWIAISFSRGSSQPRSPALQTDALPSEPPGKSKIKNMAKEVNSLAYNLRSTRVYTYWHTCVHVHTHTDEMRLAGTWSKCFFNQYIKWYSCWPEEASLCLLCHSHPLVQQGKEEERNSFSDPTLNKHNQVFTCGFGECC